jgi:molybdate transport system regulatory protein
MEPHFNVWFEIDGEVVASRWRLRLMEAIERCGSISEAARVMEVPYRIAWQKIHEMEERLGQRLLETQVGGAEGGGARLTTAGREHVALMRGFCERVDQAVAEIYRDTFRPAAGT